MTELGDWLKVRLKEEQSKSKEARRDKTRLAADIGVSTQSITNWVNGTHLPSWENCFGLTTAFDVKDGSVYRLRGFPGLTEFEAVVRAEVSDITAEEHRWLTERRAEQVANKLNEEQLQGQNRDDRALQQPPAAGSEYIRDGGNDQGSQDAGRGPRRRVRSPRTGS